MKPVLLTLCLLSFAPAAWGTEITADLLDDMPRADVVVLGEVHDNAAHHMNQARAVFSLAPKAVVWEMLSAEAASQVPKDLGDPEDVARALGWEGSGWPDFAMYYPIFVAARDARHYGAEVPRELARRSVREGALLLMPEGAQFGLGEPLPPDQQMARETEQMEAHCNAMPSDLLPGMVQAQRLRDAYLARAVAQALSEVGPPVAVITGTGHARKDWGVPAVLKRANPDLTVLSFGQLEGPAPSNPPFDLWITTEAPAREDPCAAFR